MSSGEDADNLLGWHVNQDKDKTAEFYPISSLQAEFKRPDIVKKVLDTLTEDKAIFNHQEITLTPNYELQRFEANYNGFHAAKQWRIFYQMETIEGKMSDFVEGYVRTNSDTSSITVEAVMNQSVYQPRDQFRFEVILTGEGNFDLYVGFIFPDESYYTIRPPFQFSAGNKLLPYQQDLQLEKNHVFTILSLGTGLFPAMPVGEYQACGLLTKAQSDPVDTINWVKLHCQPFKFQ